MSSRCGPMPAHEGGCLCGALRFRADAAPVDSGYCHCSLCRKSTGAPVLAWTTFPVDAFRYVAGQPRVFHSSAWGQREFCGSCGTQLVYRKREGASSVDVSIGSLDAPWSFPPQYHIHTGNQLPWLALADNLPRHVQSGPDVPLT